MGLFGGAHAKGNSGGGFNFGNAFLNLLAPDIYRRQQELAYRRAQIAHQEQEAQTAADQSRMLQEGLGALGYSKPEIQVFAAHPESATALLQSRLAPHSEGAGSRFTLPGVGGAPDQVSMAPTTDEQQAAFYDRQQPGAGAAFIQRQAYGPPIATQPGGGVIANGPQGWHDLVTPNLSDGTAPQPAAPMSPGAQGRNNPGGLRYPGSPVFRRFPTEAAGIAAQERQLGRPQYLGTPHSISQIVERYAPRRSRGGDNTDEQVNNYIAYVAQRLGVDPNAPLSAADVPRVGQAMREFETGRRGTGTIANAPRQPVQVRTPQQYAALPSGAEYIDPQGNHRRKP